MKEDTEDIKVEVDSGGNALRKFVKCFLLGLIALILGFIHYKYVSNLFENDRNFSYLSDLEREMSLRTEMGFYYSYYKTIVEEQPFIAGISKLMYDKLVEYPTEVNAFNRFNIYPEVLVGAMYRYLEPMLNTTEHRECHLVERDMGQAPVESCVGIGQPIIFYLEVIWWLAGLTVTALFLHAVTLSGNIFGGLVAVLQYFANHAECTRVQWAPNERENLALPLLLLQGWLLTLQLRDKTRKYPIQLQISIFLTNCLCLLFWQFTQFIFFAQVVIYFLMEQLHVIDSKILAIFLHSHFCGLHTAVLLLQGNDMLKSSLYTSCFLVVSVYCLFFSSLRIKVTKPMDLVKESALVVFRVCIVSIATFYLKCLMSEILEVREDSHIWDILYSKLNSGFKTFHTLIYTCTDVFGFLPYSSIEKMTQSFLIPMVILNTFNVVHAALYNASVAHGKRKVDANGEGTDNGMENNAEAKKKEEESKLKTVIRLLASAGDILIKTRIDPAIFYNISLMVVYGIMTMYVMRLKLLFGTQMCLVSSLVLTKKYYLYPKRVMVYQPLIWLFLLAPVVRELMQNVSLEISHIGEFSDYPLEEMLNWISRETGSGVFAGSMPVLATVMLTTRKPIVAHPHYEHVGARERAYTVYKVYGKFPAEELYQELSKMKATHLIVESKYCYGRSNKGCSFEDIWDIEEPSMAEQPRLCHTLLTEHVEHFYPVFRNQHYVVFRVHDYSVRYMPRTFST